MKSRKIELIRAAMEDGSPRVFLYTQRELSEARRLLEGYSRSLDEKYQRELINRQTELSALQSQINPHFLYNTLDAIRGKALIEDAPETADMVEALSRLFRYRINVPGQMVTLEQELNNLHDYMKIQTYRFGARFAYEESIEPNDALLSYELPVLSLQPLVENAIYHGLEGKLGGGRIHLCVFTTGHRLVIRVSDDGVGMDDQALGELHRKLAEGIRAVPKGGSIGLSNVNERVKLCFGQMYGLIVQSTLSVGTDVELSLPFPRGTA